MKNKKVILILVLLLVVGFASVSTTLVLTGVIGISSKQDDFKVIFTNALLDGVERKEFIDETTKQTVTFETNKLTTLEETTTLEYDVTNTSRLYDANVTINCVPTDNEYVGIEYNPTSMIVKTGKTASGSLTAKLIKASTEDRNISVTCTLNVKGLEREELGEEYIPPYNVLFDTNGGNPIDTTITVKYGDTYGELPIPTKEGYIFLGWYDEFDNKIESNSQIQDKGNRTLYAKWASEEITVTFDAVGGELSTNTKIVKYGEKIGELPIPTKSDKVFLNWKLGDKVITQDTIIDTLEDITLVATYRDQIVQVLYDYGTVNQSLTNGISYSETNLGYGISSSSSAYTKLNSNHIMLYSGVNSINNYDICVATNKAINMQGFKHVYITFSHTNAGSNFTHGGFVFALTTTRTTNQRIECDIPNSNKSTGNDVVDTISIDTTDYQNNYYIKMCNYYAGSSKIYKIWMTEL